MNKRIKKMLLLFAIVCLCILFSLIVNTNKECINTMSTTRDPSEISSEKTTYELYETEDVKQTIETEVIETEKETESIVSESIEWQIGWVTTDTDVKKEPSMDAETLEIYSYNTQIEYYIYNDEWIKVQHQLEEAYVCLEHISNEEPEYIDFTVPVTKGFKSYMPYTAITNKRSRQYRLQKIADTGTYGIRMLDNKRFCVAIGTGFNAGVGTYFDIFLKNGTVIHCIVGDIKGDPDTDESHMITVANDCMTEFIIDEDELVSMAKRMGDISYCNKEWNSRVKKIRIYDKNIFDEGE